MNFKKILDFFIRKDKLNLEKPSKKQNLQQAFRFFWFSVSAGVIQALSFALLNEVFHLNYSLVYIPSLVLSVVWSFTLNRKFTFKSVANIPRAMFKLGVYYAIFTPVSTWWGVELTNIGWNYYIVLFITMVANLITEFLVNRIFIYRNKMYTAIVIEDNPEKSLV